MSCKLVTFDFVGNRALRPGVLFGPFTFILNQAVSQNLGQFSVDIDSDILILPGHGLINGNVVRVQSSNKLPRPLIATQFYYVVHATTDAFQVSLTQSGAAIDLLDYGVGVQTLIEQGTPFDLTGCYAWAWVKAVRSDPDNLRILDLRPTIINLGFALAIQIRVDDFMTFNLAEYTDPNAVWDMIVADNTRERFAQFEGQFEIRKLATHPLDGMS